MILDEAQAVADAASWHAFGVALARYRDAVSDLLEVTQIAGVAEPDDVAAGALMQAALREVRTCWALHVGAPPQLR